MHVQQQIRGMESLVSLKSRLNWRYGTKNMEVRGESEVGDEKTTEGQL